MPTRIDYLAPEFLRSDDDDAAKPTPHKDHPLLVTGYAFWEVLILSAIITMTLLILFAEPMQAQTVGTPVPLVVMLTARDDNGTVLYHRKAYVFFGPIEEYGVGEHYLPFSDGVGIIRLMHEDGERCNPVMPIYQETGDSLSDYCAPVPAPRGRR
jgi:hypothetical protein